MKRYFLLFCMLITINLVAHDVNDQSCEKPHEMLQKIEQQINEKQKVVDRKIYMASIVLGASSAFSLYNFAKDPFYSSMGKVSVVTLLLSLFTLRFQLPKEQKVVDRLKSEQGELLQQLKEMQSK